MQAIRTGQSYSSRSGAALSSAALVFALTLCVAGVPAAAQTPGSAFQNVVMSQQVQLAALPTGGGQSGQVPAGDGMAVDAAGDVIMGNTYGGQVLLYPAAGGAPTVLGAPGSNPAGVAVDSQNNLYVALSTSASVLKVPYVNGAYATLAAPSSSTPNCTGHDTAECVMNNLNTDGSGVISLTFDAQGDLFYSTSNIGNDGAGTAPNSIWECTAACLYTGTPAAKLLFTEPTSSTPDTTGQLNIGGLATDPYGDLFFTDSAIGLTNSQESFVSNLNELVYTSGTGFAATPTVIYTYNPGTPANYDNEVDGVAVDASGTVYALVTGGPGLLAFPNANGVINTAKMYVASTTTGKLLATDGRGDFGVDLYSNSAGGDVVDWVGVNVLKATPSATSTPSTASFTTILNDGGCSPAPMVTFTLAGTGASAFSAATTGTCASTQVGASYTSTLTFTPPAVGTSTATLTAKDTNGYSGAAAVSGVGEGTVAMPVFSLAAGTYTGAQSLTLTDATLGASIYYTTDGTAPGANTGSSMLYSGAISIGSSETIHAIAVDSGDTSSGIVSAAYVINVAGAAATPTFSVAPGTYATSQSVALTDTTAGAAIFYTTDGSTPSASSIPYSGPIAVSSTETIHAVAIGGGFGTSGTATALYTINLPASAFQNVVMTQSTELGTLPSGGSQTSAAPAGGSFAVNSLGEVIAGNTYGGQVLLFSPQGGTPTVLGSYANVGPIAIDSQNNIYIGGTYTNNVVKVPYNVATNTYAAISAPSSGTSPAACTGNDTTECNFGGHLTSAGNGYYFGLVSMVFDSKGDLFYGLTDANTAPASIWECTAACLSTGTPGPVMLYQEPTSSTPATTGQLNVGSLAVDSVGDLFFTDSAISSKTSQESFSSNLDELPVSSTTGTGFAATPTVIYTYTPTTVDQYGAEIDGVSVAPNGTLYAIVQGLAGASGSTAAQTGPATGIFGFPVASGAYSSKTMYLVSTLNGKLLTNDALGNLYAADGGGNFYQITVDNIMAPTAPEANPVTVTNVATLLNDGGCTTTPPTVTFAATGTSASAFSAVTTGACTSTSTGNASFATTVTFNPTSVGVNSAMLTATDSLKNTGIAAVTGVGTPAPPAASPTFSVAAGTYTTVQTVSLADTTKGAAIYYTTDGSNPTTSSTLYSGPITVSATETLNAIADATGFQASPVASAVYTVNLPVAATPAFSVAAGTYTTPEKVSITDSIAGINIYYTLDGSTPTTKSTLYTGPITVLATETINAIAEPSAAAINYTASPVASAVYTINLPTAATPSFSVAAGTYTTVQTVSLSSSTTGATIYYTLDGTTPTSKSAVYSSPLTVGVSTTVKAIAENSPDYNNSAVATAAFVINLPPPGFTITASNSTVLVANGSGSATLTITANAAFNGAISFSCSGFLPLGASCQFVPATVTTNALGTATTNISVIVPPGAIARNRGPSPLLPGAMLAGVLCLLGFRKRRRLPMLLLAVVGAIGLSMFSGCTTTSSSSPSSSQFVVNAAGSSTPVNSPTGTPGTPVAESLQMVVTVR